MKKLAFNEKDIHTLRNLILGGALVGGGAGALTSWASQMRALSAQAERDEELKKATIPLRLLRREPAPAEEGQVKTASALAGSLGVAGGVVAGATSYQLIRKLYDMFSRQETKKRLEDAQEGYEDELLTSITDPGGHTKRAGDGDVTYSPDVLRVLPWLIGAGIPLTGYVAHLVSQRALDKAFPASNFADNIAEEMGGRPVRIDNVRVPMRRGAKVANEEAEEDPAQRVEDAELMKTAGVTEHLAGLMFVGPMLHAGMAHDAKEASPSWQWVKVAAHRPEVLDNLSLDTSMRDFEALSSQAPEPDFHSSLFANTLLLKHAGLGTQYGVLVASEVADRMPLTSAEAFEASPALKGRAVKMATALGIGLLERALMELAATDPPALIKNALLGSGDTVPDGSVDTTALKLLLQQMSKRKKVDATPKAEHTQESKQADEGQG
jgi:hypothetical protein